mmetsp:Transcript_48654/g.152747  ORF Transcript_48654/g.152747 Transcript_48654/m.152747 type:complete len:201 (+) Transcript_48654:1549-2151(+)
MSSIALVARVSSALRLRLEVSDLPCRPGLRGLRGLRGTDHTMPAMSMHVAVGPHRSVELLVELLLLSVLDAERVVCCLLLPGLEVSRLLNSSRAISEAPLEHDPLSAASIPHLALDLCNASWAHPCCRRRLMNSTPVGGKGRRLEDHGRPSSHSTTAHHHLVHRWKASHCHLHSSEVVEATAHQTLSNFIRSPPPTSPPS